jgi:hypothetical protein
MSNLSSRHLYIYISACIDCQVGSYSNVSGATSASVCTECYAGMYVNTTSSECITCPAGKYSKKTATTCTACLGNTTSIAGSTSASNCTCAKNNTYYKFAEGITSLEQKCGKDKTKTCQTDMYTSNPISMMDYPSRCAVDVGVNSEYTGANLVSENLQKCAWLSIDLETSQEIFSVNIKGVAYGFEIQVGDLNEIDKNPKCGQYDHWDRIFYWPNAFNSEKGATLQCQNVLWGRYVFLKTYNYKTNDCGGSQIVNVRISSPTIDCASCPTNTYSAFTGSITDCKCNIGYTGPDAGPCSACVANTSKETYGNESCSCVPGTANHPKRLLPMYSNTVCPRLLALTYKPSFASVSTRRMAGQAFSASLPTYTSNGGPNGKGSLFFDGSRNIDAGARTYNIVSNGGFTFVSVLRRQYTDAATIFDSAPILYSGSVYGRILVTAINGYWNSESGSLKFHVFDPSRSNARTIECEKYYAKPTGDSSSWLKVVIQIKQNEATFRINDHFVTYCGIQLSYPLADMSTSYNFVGRSASSTTTTQEYAAPFKGDIAGLFVADEYLSTSTTSAILDAMLQGVDLTETCDFCVECTAGSYSNVSSSTACIKCEANTYSNVHAAVNASTCLPCPSNSTSVAGSSVCVCRLGYTGTDGVACTACATGKYSPTNGSGGCLPCPDNSNSSVGSVICTCNADSLGPDGGRCMLNPVLWYRFETEGEFNNNGLAGSEYDLEKLGTTPALDATVYRDGLASARFTAWASGTVDNLYQNKALWNKNVPLTFTFWFRWTQSTYISMAGFAGPIKSSGADNQGIGFDINDPSQGCYAFYDQAPNKWAPTPSGCGIALNTWYHVAYSLSFPGSAILYLNGVVVRTISMTAVFPSNVIGRVHIGGVFGFRGFGG